MGFIILVFVLGSTSLPQAAQGSNLTISDIDINTFISKWDTRLISSESSASNQIKLPLESSGIYSVFVKWGDGKSDLISRSKEAIVKHTYASEGVYTITMDGPLIGWRFNGGGDKLKIIEISQWGNIRLGNSGGYFKGSSNLQITATDAPNLTGITTFYQAFMGCTNLGNSDNMNNWDVSGVTNMDSMFSNAISFNQPIGNWDVSSVTDMNNMFDGASSFNQPIGNWKVYSVTSMEYMFSDATGYNQDINKWDVSSVTSMDSMFSNAISFNQPIGNWDVSSVYYVENMFNSAFSFDQDISKWDISRITRLDYMFSYAYSFNQPIDSWDVSNIISLDYLFNGASSFNQPLSNWDVSSVTSMALMFSASSFNQPIGDWNVSSVSNMIWILNGVKLSVTNYDNLLSGWERLTLQTGVNFDAGNSLYSNSDARQHIVDLFSWTITDLGLAEFIPPSSENPLTAESTEIGTNSNTNNKTRSTTTFVAQALGPFTPSIIFLAMISITLWKSRRKIEWSIK